MRRIYMIIKTEEYSINCTESNKANIIGSMRLPSPLSYENLFEPIKNKIEKSSESYTIDVQNLNYLNSSGLTALARILILDVIKKTYNIISKQQHTMAKKELTFT